MNKKQSFFRSKEQAQKAVRESARAFYVIGVVIAVFALYILVQGDGLFALFTLLIAGSFVAPAYLAAKSPNLIGPILLIALVTVNAIGIFTEFELTPSWIIQTFISVTLFVLAVRMLVATLWLRRHGKMSA